MRLPLIALFVCSVCLPVFSQSGQPIRARQLGVPFEGQPGPLDAITDVAGVEVGSTTLISGNGPL
jgi:D-aminopeptidase